MASTMVNSALICIAAHLLLGLVRAEAILFYQDPVDTIVGLNKWTDFNCTVNCNCTEHVGWYMAGNNKAIKNNESIPGLTIRTGSSNTSSSGQETYVLEVLATEALNKSAIYCGAVSNCQHECSASRRCYSRPALLIVRAATTDTTALYTISSSRTPEIAPSPLSYSAHTLQGNTTGQYCRGSNQIIIHHIMVQWPGTMSWYIVLVYRECTGSIFIHSV